MNNGYRVEIKASSKELTAREKIRLKDTSNAIKLDEATKEEALIITPVAYAILSVHNEKSDNKDYEIYLIEDKDGAKYVTGSQSFWNSFFGIYDEMKDEEETYDIMCYRLPSKNYKNKEFLTCSLM